ncbi:MAG: ABC transporter permease [Acidobacteriota bacterium]|nr:ABC transporter permease [Acidobacteriota bacterium]
MVISNLVHRPLRTVISVFAIAIEVTLILLIVGLCLSMLNDNADRQKGIGFDVMVSPPGSSFFTGITGAPVSIRVADKLRTLPHVAAVSPIVMHFITTKNPEVIDGIELDPNSPNDFNKMGRPFQYLSGGPFQGPNDMIVDDLFAQDHHAKVGDEFEVLNQKFRVSGIVEHGKGARRYIPIATLSELLGSEGKASMFYVRTDSPQNAAAVVEAIKATPGMEQYVARSLAEYASLMTVNNIPFLATFFNIVIGIALTIGFIVIFQSMYTAVMERTREIGILKSLGATRLYILNVILREAFVLAIGGVLMGLLLTALASAGINHKFPLHKMVWDYHWVMRATVLAVIGALVGAIYPALRAAQKDPIEALAYE